MQSLRQGPLLLFAVTTALVVTNTGDAWALKRKQLQRHELSAAEMKADGKAPRARVSAQLYRRLDGPDGGGKHGLVLLAVDAAFDNRTPASKLGYDIRVLGGSAPVWIPDYPVRAFRGRIWLEWRESTETSKRAVRFRVLVTPIDLAGNRGEPTTLVVEEDAALGGSYLEALMSAFPDVPEQQQHQIDLQERDVDAEPPVARLGGTAQVYRGIKRASGWTEKDAHGAMVLTVEAAFDDRTAMDLLGYEFSLVGGTAPDGLFLPHEAIRPRRDGTIWLHWNDGKATPQEPLWCMFKVTPVDLAGNRGRSVLVTAADDGAGPPLLPGPRPGTHVSPTAGGPSGDDVAAPRVTISPPREGFPWYAAILGGLAAIAVVTIGWLLLRARRKRSASEYLGQIGASEE